MNSRTKMGSFNTYPMLFKWRFAYNHTQSVFIITNLTFKTLSFSIQLDWIYWWIHWWQLLRMCACIYLCRFLWVCSSPWENSRVNRRTGYFSIPAIWCLLSSPDLHHLNHSANTFLFLSLIHLLNNPLPENVSLILFISTPPSLIPSLRNIYARFNSILFTNSEFLLWSSPPGKFALTSSEVINALCIFSFYPYWQQRNIFSTTATKWRAKDAPYIYNWWIISAFHPAVENDGKCSLVTQAWRLINRLND